MNITIAIAGEFYYCQCDENENMLEVRAVTPIFPQPNFDYSLVVPVNRIIFVKAGSLRRICVGDMMIKSSIVTAMLLKK